MKKNTKIIADTTINIIFKAITFVFALLISKFIIRYYGSSTNGLLSLITQVFTYVALLESGIGNATQQLYFKAFAKKKYKDAKIIYNSSVRNYQSAARLYMIFAVIIAFLIPITTKSNLSNITVIILAILQSIIGVITFAYLSSYKNAMIASGDYKISNIYNSVAYIVIVLCKILCMVLNTSVIIMQASQVIGTLLEITITRRYCRKKYEWLGLHDEEVIKLEQRRAFLIHEISGVIFSSTDIITLSVLCSLETASVYSVYNIIYSAIASVAAVISTSIIHYIGVGYNKDPKTYHIIHDRFECIYISIIFAIVTTATIICPSFIKIYTSGITDVNYNIPYLAVFFAAIQILTCGRSISNRLIGIAGYAKKTQMRSVIEAGLNVFFSVILTIKFGIYGVLAGTIIATIYRTIDVLFYANHKILNRKNILIFIMLLVDFGLFAMFIYFGEKIVTTCSNYFNLLLVAIICGIIALIVFVIINILIYLVIPKKNKLVN